MYLKVNIVALSCKQCCSVKGIITKYSDTVSLALGMKQAIRIAILSFATFLTLHYFSTLLLKIYEIFKMAFNIKYLFKFSLQRLSETCIILGRTERDMIKPLLVFMETTVIFVGFLRELIILYFRKIFMYQISRQSVQWDPSCSMRTDEQIEKTQLKWFIVSLPRCLYQALCRCRSLTIRSVWRKLWMWIMKQKLF